ncbi:MAG: ribonuclease HI [Deltaproteobacteria bacterium]|nr:MAG: ribonuclease HI [Deltaproteobacteria bacterium]
MGVKLFVDGACLNNPGPGGWAAMIVTSYSSTIFSGGEVESTNNKMELVSIIRGIEFIRANFMIKSEIKIFSDSSYVVHGASRWLAIWKKAQWKRSGKLIPNFYYWKEIAELIREIDIRWVWIRGHCGIMENDIVDKVAKLEALRFLN